MCLSYLDKGITLLQASQMATSPLASHSSSSESVSYSESYLSSSGWSKAERSYGGNFFEDDLLEVDVDGKNMSSSKLGSSLSFAFSTML